MNIKQIFKIDQGYVIIGKYGGRLGNTDQASILTVKLNTLSLVASEREKEGVENPQDVKKCEFNV